MSRRVPRLLACRAPSGSRSPCRASRDAQRVHVLAVTGLSGEPAYRAAVRVRGVDARGQRTGAVARARLEHGRAGGRRERHSDARDGTRDAPGHRAGVPHSFAARRARRHRAGVPRRPRLRRRGRVARQPSGARCHGGRLRWVDRGIRAADGGVRERRERQRRLRGGARGPEARDRHRHSHGPRAERDALRHAVRARAHDGRGGRRQGRPRLRARGVRVCEAGGGESVRDRQAAPHGARRDQRQHAGALGLVRRAEEHDDGPARGGARRRAVGARGAGGHAARRGRTR